MKYVAIDIGSSFIKSAILDVGALKIFGQEIVSMPPRFSNKPGRFEVDADLIFTAVRNLIDCYLDKFGREIKGILFSTQMHGFVLTDEQGSPLTHYISWQDERSLDELPSGGITYLQRLETIISREDMQEAGVYLKPPLALCNLYTLLNQGFVIPANTHFCTLGSYVIFRLTGRNVCHLTNAAPTGFANIVRQCWNDQIIDKIDGSRLIFPELSNSVERCADYRYKNQNVAVYPDIGDQQACVLGCMARPEEDVNINIGTAAQIAVIRRRFGSAYGEVRPFFDDCYLNTISRMPGGRNLDVLIGFLQDAGETVFDVALKKSAIWDRVIPLACRSGTKGLKVKTGFFKTMAADCGVITNINDSNMNIGTLFSAAFEDFASTYDAYITKLCQDRSTIKRIVFSGGVASKNPALLQEICRVTALKGVLPPMADEVFIGLFRLALLCSKMCANVEETYETLVTDRENNKIRVRLYESR